MNKKAYLEVVNNYKNGMVNNPELVSFEFNDPDDVLSDMIDCTDIIDRFEYSDLEEAIMHLYEEITELGTRDMRGNKK